MKNIARNIANQNPEQSALDIAVQEMQEAARLARANCQIFVETLHVLDQQMEKLDKNVGLYKHGLTSIDSKLETQLETLKKIDKALTQ